jgi:hypothetical protein
VPEISVPITIFIRANVKGRFAWLWGPEGRSSCHGNGVRVLYQAARKRHEDQTE